KDIWASALTRVSPLQKSNPYLDRALRCLGSASTGAATGAGFAAVSSAISAAAGTDSPLAPLIQVPISTIVAAGASAGAVAGATSGTKLDYISRCFNFPTRFFVDDRSMGGMHALLNEVKNCMLKRKFSTLARLLAENPLKAALNISGFSLPESLVKALLHLTDGWIAETEIADFGEWRKAHQKLLSSANAINIAFAGKELNTYNQKILKEILGEDDFNRLSLTSSDGATDNPIWQRKLAGLANVLGYYVMIADLYYFLVNPITEATQPYDGNECPAKTSSLPYAGKGFLECRIAIYEAIRKGNVIDGFNGAALRRFFDTALVKSLANTTMYWNVKAHNAALGKKSVDPAMSVTLKAGLVKNSALGPLERLLQMSDQIMLKCVGDIINQLNTSIKEAMESAGQRERDKATEALKKTARDLFWRCLEAADYNLHDAEKILVDIVSSWQNNIGFNSLNSFANMRQLIAQQTLQQCDVDENDFSSYKNTAMGKLEAVMPSITDKSAIIRDEVTEDVELLKNHVNKFLNDITADKDMYKAVSPLLDTLSSVDKKAVDSFVESMIYEPISRKPSEKAPSSSNDTLWTNIKNSYNDLESVA
ncbi:MAG: hypothetical protein ACPGEF_04540, partial [Endozoicomonas sp.]